MRGGFEIEKGFVVYWGGFWCGIRRFVGFLVFEGRFLGLGFFWRGFGINLKGVIIMVFVWYWIFCKVLYVMKFKSGKLKGWKK